MHAPKERKKGAKNFLTTRISEDRDIVESALYKQWIKGGIRWFHSPAACVVFAHFWGFTTTIYSLRSHSLNAPPKATIVKRNGNKENIMGAQLKNITILYVWLCASICQVFRHPLKYSIQSNIPSILGGSFKKKLNRGKYVYCAIPTYPITHYRVTRP